MSFYCLLHVSAFGSYHSAIKNKIKIKNLIFVGGDRGSTVVKVFLFVYFWPFTAPQWAMASSFTRFLDHTQRRITFGRTPLDE